jgi:tellurite resistance protein
MLEPPGAMTKTPSASARISPHRALIYTMILVAGADRDLAPRELKLIGRKARQLPVFDGFDDADLPGIAQECAVIVHADNGVERALRLIAAALPKHLRETCYLCAVEVAAVDGQVPLEELRILQRLRQVLRLDRLVTAALERAIQARLATL